MHEPTVRFSRCRDGHCSDIWIGENFIERAGVPCRWVLDRELRSPFLAQLADARQNTEVGEIPHQVLSPVPSTDHGDCGIDCHYNISRAAVTRVNQSLKLQPAEWP